MGPGSLLLLGEELLEPDPSFGHPAAYLIDMQAWFKSGDFWVTRARRDGRVLKPDFGRGVIVCWRPAGLRGSRSLGLRRAETQ
jgi:hypothetical protein